MKHFLGIRFCPIQSFHTFLLNAWKLGKYRAKKRLDNTESNVWKYVIYINIVAECFQAKIDWMKFLEKEMAFFPSNTYESMFFSRWNWAISRDKILYSYDLRGFKNAITHLIHFIYNKFYKQFCFLNITISLQIPILLSILYYTLMRNVLFIVYCQLLLHA